MAVLIALQTWGCNAPKPLRSSRVPIPTMSSHQLIKLSSVKNSRISRVHASKFLILKHFDRHSEEILFIVTIFVASCQTGGAKPKTGDAIALPAPT